MPSKVDPVGIATRGKVNQKGKTDAGLMMTKVVPSKPFLIELVWRAASVFQPISIYNKAGRTFGPIFRAINKKRPKS